MPQLETELLAHLRETLSRNDAWSAFSTGWFLFDCELMPWSVKADELVRNQYAVHECVFGVLALESEPVDPRL